MSLLLLLDMLQAHCTTTPAALPALYAVLLLGYHNTARAKTSAAG